MTECPYGPDSTPTIGMTVPVRLKSLVKGKMLRLDEVRRIAEDAYIFGYPLILMEATRRRSTGVPHPFSFLAPVNQFGHFTKLPDARFDAVVSMSIDTLFSSLWMDLSKEPLILSVPDIDGRFYGMPTLDAWTNVFATIGARTTGTEAHNFAFCGPNWQGELPDDVIMVTSPTNMAWTIGSIQVNGRDDAPLVNKIQFALKATPLSAWGTEYEPPREVPVDHKPDARAPVDRVAEMEPISYFNLLAGLMIDNPPRSSDIGMVMRMVKIGLAAGEKFDLEGLDAEVQKAIEEGAKNGLAKIKDWAANPVGESINGWFLIYAGEYGTDYLKRAGIACVGLGASLPEDWVYPLSRTDANGQPYTGEINYVLHFKKDEIPPVKACWSLTMYNNRQFFVDNPINRYAIGDHDQANKLKFNEDGSIDIFIQNESPGKDKESNWLPSPKDGFNLILRCGWPEQRILNHEWAPPAVQKILKE